MVGADGALRPGKIEFAKVCRTTRKRHLHNRYGNRLEPRYAAALLCIGGDQAGKLRLSG